MISFTVQGTHVFAPLPNENQEHFLRRIAFFERCTQWMCEFERTMLAKDIPGGMSSGFSVQFSTHFSSVTCGITEFRWRNLAFCTVLFDSSTNEITTRLLGIVKQRFDALKQESPFNGVKMLGGFLIEVVKNEISKLEQLRDALK